MPHLIKCYNKASNKPKTFEEFKKFIEGGKVIEAGAKMIPEGGYNAIPRGSDNEIGLYDKVTKQFFTNQGTGTFIGG